MVFLDHIVLEEGVSTNPANVQLLPVGLSQASSAIPGFVQLLPSLYPGLCYHAKPLHQLTEKTCEFQWSDQCAEASWKLLQAPILAFPDFTKTFFLNTDVSTDKIGAFLSQEDDSRETVVAYTSRVLSKAKRRYFVTRRELLAVVTFLQHIRPYLLRRHFIVRTDHKFLT